MTNEWPPDVLREAQNQELSRAESRLSDLEERFRKLRLEIDGARKIVDAYRVILGLDGGNVTQPVAAMDLFSTVQNKPTRGRGGHKVGNRQSKMPLRTQRFADTSVHDAVISLAQEWGISRHADNYARQIWQITNKKDLHLAKRTLNSTLARLNIEGKLKKTAPNTFGPPTREGQGKT
ncbi:MAG: hypothetical protein HW384_598 [Dehalococcoidia bacterium]|nr:hypothetical protein [Dehalococcoidia bacterium]